MKKSSKRVIGILILIGLFLALVALIGSAYSVQYAIAVLGGVILFVTLIVLAGHLIFSE